MTIERNGGRTPEHRHSGKDMAVPTDRSLRPHTKELSPISPVYPRTLQEVTGVIDIPSIKRVSAADAPKFHELVSTSNQQNHLDVVGSSADTAAAVSAIALPLVHERPGAKVIILDMTGTGASDTIVHDFQKRGIHARADVPTPGELLRLRNPSIEQVADSIAKAITSPEDRDGRRETRGIVRTIGNALTQVDPEGGNPTLLEYRDAVRVLRNMNHGHPNADEIIENTYPDNEERTELRTKFRNLENGINDMLTLEKPADDNDQDEREVPQVQAFKLPMDGLSDVEERKELLTARVAQVLATDAEHGTPALLAVMGADRLSPANQTLLREACIANGVDDVFVHHTLTPETSGNLGQYGPIVVMGTQNGEVAQRLEAILGTEWGEVQTGRSKSSNNSSSTSTTHDTNKTKTQNYMQERTNLGFRQKGGFSVTETDHTTINTSESHTTDEGEQWTIGPKARVRQDQLLEIPSGGGYVVRRGPSGPEVATFYLPIDADRGLHKPFAVEAAEKFPGIKEGRRAHQFELPVRQDEARSEKPSILHPIQRSRHNRQEVARVETAISQTQGVRRDLHEAGLSLGHFVDMTVGERIVPDPESLSRQQQEAFVHFASLPDDIQRRTLTQMARSVELGPEIVGRAFDVDAQSEQVHTIYTSRTRENYTIESPEQTRELPQTTIYDGE